MFVASAKVELPSLLLIPLAPANASNCTTTLNTLDFPVVPLPASALLPFPQRLLAHSLTLPFLLLSLFHPTLFILLVLQEEDAYAVSLVLSFP